MAPKPVLAGAVGQERGRIRAACGLRVNERASQTGVKLRLRFGGVKLTQAYLAVRPCELEGEKGRTTAVSCAGFSISASAPARVSAMPTTKLTLTSAPGAMVTVRRSATTGSRTEPAVFDSGPGRWSAAGDPALAPRPRKRRRSVSHEAGLSSCRRAPPWRPNIQGGFSPGARGRRVHRTADLRRHELRLDKEAALKAGCDASVAAGASTTSR